jgi:hypothetical protein
MDQLLDQAATAFHRFGEKMTPVRYLDKEQATVEEALRRGASNRLLATWLFWRRSNKQPGQVGPEYQALRPALLKLIQPQLLDYRQQVTAEFNSLRIRFGDPERVHSDLEHYHALRPIYYLAGYSNPLADIFQRIRPIPFLGKPTTGIHDAFAPVLARAVAILSAVAPELPGNVTAALQDSTIGAFVPRFIAGSAKLSNHAFGLAIDLDPASNPHLKNPVIPVLNKIVSAQIGRPFDFGKSFVEGKHWTGVLNDEQKTKVAHAYGRTGSLALQEWLKQHLPTYEQCVTKIAAGKNAAAGTALKQQADEAQQIIAEDSDLRLLQQLNGDVKAGFPTLATLRVWMQKGVQTIPLELAVALRQAIRESGQTGGWGQQDYEHSKDTMHFEIDAASAIPPDSGPRTLRELFPPEIRPFCDSGIYDAELDQPWPNVGFAGIH